MFNKKRLRKLIAASIAIGVLAFVPTMYPVNNINNVPVLQTSTAHAASAKDHFNRGVNYSNAGNHNAAIEEFTTAILLSIQYNDDKTTVKQKMMNESKYFAKQFQNRNR